MSVLSDALLEQLKELARVPVLLVASDFDGTLSPIVEDPAAARPHREGMVALHNLALLPRTHVTIISGRSLRDLAELTGSPGNVHLVGSHGSEFDPDFAERMPAEAKALREHLLAELNLIAEQTPGSSVETKPASVAFHFRNAEREAGEASAQRVIDELSSLDGVQLKRGKMVVELGVIEADKGLALESIRHRVGASAAIFLGDDVTDEDAFATLRGPDVGVKVGEGASGAALRVDSTMDVALVLATLAELRAEEIAGSHACPIERHSMLSDQRAIAMVDHAARVNWLCAPRIDSPAMFSELLGGPSDGFFAITDEHGQGPRSQAYADGSMVLESRWPAITVTDYLDTSGDPTDDSEGTTLIRVIEGTGRALLHFCPRIDYARTPTRLRQIHHGLQLTEVLDAVVLRSPGVEWEIDEDGHSHSAHAEVNLAHGPVTIELRIGAEDASERGAPEPDRRDRTQRFWADWLAGLTLPSLRPELMRSSALALRGLAYGPSGAIAAAGTTSLPEGLGGVRNWDYRYCWPRDSAMTATTLARIGSTAEAARLLEWMHEVVQRAGGAERLAPLYDVRGHEPPPEAEITTLSGYAGSRPVRIGNGASRQVQLDVFGPVAELIWVYGDRGGALTEAHHDLMRAMASAVERRWREPDHGIWEIRGPLQEHVHSKAMCWLTLDRAARIARTSDERDRLRSSADLIRDEVIERGWNDEARAFTASYGSRELDASALLLGLGGLLDPMDERFVATVEAVERGLRSGPTVYRYLYDDSLPGREGGFHICAMWLVEAMALVGRLDEARELFDEVADLAGPTGLLSEQYDPVEGVALGNHPQAYSHLGLIDAALRLESLA